MSEQTNNDSVSILREQLDDLRSQLRKLTGERDEAYTAIRELTTERDTIQAAVGGDTDKLTAAETRVAELETAARERGHKDKFSELAKAGGAKEAAINHLWQISGFKAEEDEVDAKALGKLVEKLKKEADYCFGSPEPETPSPRAEKDRITSRTKYGLEIRGETPEPTGGGRGGRAAGQDGTIITAEMRGDPAFMLDPRNKEMIAEAARDGRFR